MYFKQSREFRDDPSRLDKIQLKQDFDELTEHDKFYFQVQADKNLDRGPFLHSEICDLLKRTKGTITCREIAS